MIRRPAFLLSVSCTTTWVIMQYLPNTLSLILCWISNPNRKDIFKLGYHSEDISYKWGRDLFWDLHSKILFSSFPTVTCRSAVGCRVCNMLGRKIPSCFVKKHQQWAEHFQKALGTTGTQESWPEPDWSDLGPDPVAGYLGAPEKATTPRNSARIKISGGRKERPAGEPQVPVSCSLGCKQCFQS